MTSSVLFFKGIVNDFNAVRPGLSMQRYINLKP